MGVSSSTLSQLISEEFHRLAKGNGYLTLDDVLQFRINVGINIDLESIAVLFDLDRRVRSPNSCSCTRAAAIQTCCSLRQASSRSCRAPAPHIAQ